MNRVFKFGCRAPNESKITLQLLGQAWLYREDLRRAYNENKRNVKAALQAGDDASHVVAWLHARLNANIRNARKRRGHLIDCGTYWLIEAAMLAASKASGLDLIKSQQWDATGRIGAAIQSREQFPAENWNHKRVRLTEPNTKKHALLTIHIGEAKNGHDITWPIKLHRPFPDNAVIKQVAIQRIRIGHRYRWEALITISTNDGKGIDKNAQGVVGIDIGWRDEFELGQRVATHDAIDDTNVIRVDTRESFLYADEVRRTRDRLFDEAKTYAHKSQIPGAGYAHLWKNKTRLHHLANAIENLGLSWWALRDKHLEDIECGVRIRAKRRRLDVFRKYADCLAKKYQILAIEDMPMQDWVGKGETSGLERRRSCAALSLLQLVLIERFGSDRIDWVPAEYTTMTCAKCHAVRDKPVGRPAHWVCVCGIEHHQDANAAEVIRLSSERWRGEGNPLRARSRKPKKKETKKEKSQIVPQVETAATREARSEAAE